MKVRAKSCGGLGGMRCNCCGGRLGRKAGKRLVRSKRRSAKRDAIREQTR